MDTSPKKFTIGAVLFEGFEILDFFGPLEMFAGMKESVEIVTIAERPGRVESANRAPGFADVSFEEAPELDIILIPGGVGSRTVLKDESFLQWLRARADRAEYVTSVCTGALILAASSLIDGKRATSNKWAWEWTEKVGPNVNWVPKARWVVDGKYVTSAGVSAGMDMALALIEMIWGEEARERIRVLSEYDWHSDPSWDPFAKLYGLE